MVPPLTTVTVTRFEAIVSVIPELTVHVSAFAMVWFVVIVHVSGEVLQIAPGIVKQEA